MSSLNYGKINKLNDYIQYNGDLIINTPLKENRNRWIVAIYYREINRTSDNQRIEYVMIMIDNYSNIYRFIYHYVCRSHLLSSYDNKYNCVKNHQMIDFTLEDNMTHSSALTDDEIDYIYDVFNKLNIRTANVKAHFQKIDDFINNFIKSKEEQNKDEYFEEENIKEYKSDIDKWSGRLVEESLSLYILYKKDYDKTYEDCEIWGDWNNWTTAFELIHYKSIDNNNIWLIEFNSEEDLPKLGKYHYKFKRGGMWIEPTENDLREKDEHGNWNFVLFVHN